MAIPRSAGRAQRPEKYQAADGIGMVAGEQPGGQRAPGMRDQMHPRAVTLLSDVIDHRADLAGRGRRAADRRMIGGRRVHGRRPGRAAIAREIERPDVEATRCKSSAQEHPPNR